MTGGHQHQASESIGLILKPVVIGFVNLSLELLPLVYTAEFEFGVETAMQIEMPEFVRQREAITVQPPLEHELIDGNARQITGNETIDIKKVAESGQGYDVEPAFDLGDLFDGRRNRPLGMEFAQELLGQPADVAV